MKSPLSILLFCLLQLSALAQQPVRPVCDSMLLRGDELYRKGGSLSEALRNYLNALNCDTRLADVVGPKIQAVFQAIEAQRGREAQARRSAEQRRKEAEIEKRRAKSSELAARALLAYWRDRDATRSFRYAHYAYSYDTTNAEAVAVLYSLYFSQPSPQAVPSLPMYFNSSGNLWRDFTFHLALRGVDSAAVSPFAAFDTLFDEERFTYRGYGPMPTGNYYSVTKKYKIAALSNDQTTSVVLYWNDGGDYRELDIPKTADGIIQNMRLSDEEHYLLAEEENVTTLYWLNDYGNGEPLLLRVVTVAPPHVLRIERHGENLFAWIDNVMGPSSTIYRLDEDQLTYLKAIDGWVDTYGDFLTYREKNTNRRVIDRFDFDLVNVLVTEDLPYRFDFDGLPMAMVDEQETDRPEPPDSRRYRLQEDGKRIAVCDRQGRVLLFYSLDTTELCNQSFYWDHTPDEHYALLVGELYTGGEGGAGCPFGQIVRIWDDRLGLAYAFPLEFMGLDDHDGGVIRFLDNRHLQVGGYRWMLDPKDIIRTYHERGYWDLPSAEKRSMGIREEEMEWRVGGKSE